MVVERSWILGVLACALVAPTACGGISQSHSDGGEAGDGANGGNGASGGDGGFPGSGGSIPGTGAVGGTSTGGVGAGGVSPSGGTFGGTTPAGGAINTGGSGGVSTGGKGGTSTGGSFTGGNGMGAAGGAVPMGGVGGTTPVPDLGIPWDETGFIAGGDNSFEIQGSWYFATDCGSTAGTGLTCTTPDPNLIGPDLVPGWATSPARACMRGVATQILNSPATGMPAYDLQWGALFGFQLAEGAGYNANAYGIRGFTFDLTANFEARLRVNVVSTTTVGISHFVELIVPTVNQTVYFTDALQGSWVTMPVALDTSALTSIEFHVYTNTAASTPYDICVSNVRAVLW